MSFDHHGELTPMEGGDSLPLLRPIMTVGRRESCDICLSFPNISGQHCELSLRNGVWFIRDLNSTNGTKVNGVRIQEQSLAPGDVIIIGKRQYTIQYTLPNGVEIATDDSLNVMGKSLMEKAGLTREPRFASRPRSPHKQATA